MALRKYAKRKVSAAISDAGKMERPADATPQGPEQTPVDAPVAQQGPDQARVGEAPTPQPTAAAASAPDLISLKAQLDLMRRGQEQRTSEAAQIAAMASTPLEQQLEKIPGLSVAQKAYLRERPFALARFDILSAVHEFSKQNDIPIDSPQYFQLMDRALLQWGNIPFITPPTVTAESAVSPSPPEPETPMPQPPQPPAPPQSDAPERSHIYSAPISRSEYPGSASPLSPSRVTLTPDERAAA